VVVNVPATWSVRYPYTYAFLWNLALAGSKGLVTPSFGTTEDEVYKGVSDKIAAAAYHFPYTTTAPVAGASTQDMSSKSLTFSTLLYAPSVSYPSWKGTVRAFDATSGNLMWSAADVAVAGTPTTPDWTHRRIYFSDLSGNVAKVQISGTASNPTIVNAGALNSAGLGASSDEAAKIMRWLLGGLDNPAPLMGATTASTPIVVGQGGANGLDGSNAYATLTQYRPQLVYIGGDDGMLHAFFAHVGEKTLGGVKYEGGEEAFAFIPYDMLPVITKQYAQGGQKLAVDKSQHIFGLAASPKVKDMCFGANCNGALTGADWHTVLVMPEGPGGNKPFALDITGVIDAINGLQLNNLSLLWSMAPNAAIPAASDRAAWDASLGETTSVPAFYFAGYPSSTAKADNRVLFASGYPITSTTQGQYIVNADATTGAVKDHINVLTKGGTTGCAQTYGILADIGLARNYTSESTSQYLMAAYVADTFGNTYQYVPGATDQTKVLTLLYHLDCKQPIYFGPAVVQLDRNPKANSSAKNIVYLVQVTNSNLDPATMLYSSQYPGSQIVVTKLDGNFIPPVPVASYGSSGNGQIILSTDPSASASNRICIQTTNSTSFTGSRNTKTATQSCQDAGGAPLPSSARPVGTPLVVMRSDGLGFQAIVSWFDPTTSSNDCSGSNSYNYGTSYVTVHEFGASGAFYQIAGFTYAKTVLTGATFVGTSLFLDGINAAAVPQSLSFGNQTFSKMQDAANNPGADRYVRTTWTERVDL
jgi:hypothetical protein